MQAGDFYLNSEKAINSSEVTSLNRLANDLLDVNLDGVVMRSARQIRKQGGGRGIGEICRKQNIKLDSIITWTD